MFVPQQFAGQQARPQQYQYGSVGGYYPQQQDQMGGMIQSMMPMFMMMMMMALIMPMMKGITGQATSR